MAVTLSTVPELKRYLERLTKDRNKKGLASLARQLKENAPKGPDGAKVRKFAEAAVAYKRAVTLLEDGDTAGGNLCLRDARAQLERFDRRSKSSPKGKRGRKKAAKRGARKAGARKAKTGARKKARRNPQVVPTGRLLKIADCILRFQHGNPEYTGATSGQLWKGIQAIDWFGICHVTDVKKTEFNTALKYLRESAAVIRRSRRNPGDTAAKVKNAAKRAGAALARAADPGAAPEGSQSAAYHATALAKRGYRTAHRWATQASRGWRENPVDGAGTGAALSDHALRFFAPNVMEAAEACEPHGISGFWISEVYASYRQLFGTAHRVTSLDAFKQALLQAHRAGYLTLSRADVPGPQSRQSAIRYLNATFHLVQAADAPRGRRKNPALESEPRRPIQSLGAFASEVLEAAENVPPAAHGELSRWASHVFKAWQKEFDRSRVYTRDRFYRALVQAEEAGHLILGYVPPAPGRSAVANASAIRTPHGMFNVIQLDVT